MKISITKTYVNDFAGPEIVEILKMSVINIREAEATGYGPIREKVKLRKELLNEISKYVKQHFK
jgi:hypothetical protein